MTVLLSRSDLCEGVVRLVGYVVGGARAARSTGNSWPGGGGLCRSSVTWLG